MVVILLTAVVGLFCVCAGAGFVAQIPFTLAFGWVSYLGRVVPKLNPDPASVATAVACLLGVVFGGHAFLKWLYAATDPRREPISEPRRWPWKWTLMLTGLVVLMFASGIAVTGMAHQTGWLLRSPEPLTKNSRALSVSRIHLGQMAVGAQSFADKNGRLPQSRFDAQGRPLHSWQTELLPYIEQATVHQQIDLSKPWTDPANAQAMITPIKPYLNPAVPDDRVNGFAVSHYAGNVQVVLTDQPKKLASFPQGTSNVIFAGEVSANFRAWGDPLNARDPRLGVNHPHGFGGPNNRPAQFGMLDGSVRTFDPAALAELLGKVPE
jgi:hypothetical protein